MSSLGVYFGPKIISVVETKGRKVSANIRIPQAAIASGELGLEEKVPAEVKIVAILKDELRKSNIDAKEATLSLSGSDIIIRTFDMQQLPREELEPAINFEAKKYIPFKVEELISDFQVQFDKISGKNIVLFMGIKKEVLARYLSAFSQLNIKISGLEYSAFSLLRAMKLSGISDKGVTAVFAADLGEEDEANFAVLENGFPLFTRDISLALLPDGFGKAEGAPDPGMGVEKIKTEIRVSLDYYSRKFPAKKIEKLFFICNDDSRTELEAFMSEIGLSAQFVNATAIAPAEAGYSLSFLKGFSASLSRVVKSGIKPDLLTVRERVKAAPIDTSALFKGIKIDAKMIALGVLICAATFGFGAYRILPLRRQLADIKGMRPPVLSVNPESSYEELSAQEAEFKKKLSALNDVVKKQLLLTEPLNVIPLALPDGVWLARFSFNKAADNKVKLVLEGSCSLSDADKEFQAVEKFLQNLKANPDFSKYFTFISIDSLNRSQDNKTGVTNFQITCVNYSQKD